MKEAGWFPGKSKHPSLVRLSEEANVAGAKGQGKESYSVSCSSRALQLVAYADWEGKSSQIFFLNQL